MTQLLKSRLSPTIAAHLNSKPNTKIIARYREDREVFLLLSRHFTFQRNRESSKTFPEFVNSNRCEIEA